MPEVQMRLEATLIKAGEFESHRFDLNVGGSVGTFSAETRGENRSSLAGVVEWAKHFVQARYSKPKDWEEPLVFVATFVNVGRPIPEASFDEVVQALVELFKVPPDKLVIQKEEKEEEPLSA